MSSDFLKPTSDFQTPITFLLVGKNTNVRIHFKEIFGYKIALFTQTSIYGVIVYFCYVMSH